jgi:hypothetical protein
VREKADFLREIHSVRMQAFKQRTIRNSFTERGIYPLNPDLVLEPLHAARSPTPELQIWDGNRVLDRFTPGKTPPISSSTTNSPPTTVTKLRRSINKAKKALVEDLDTVSTRLNTRLERIFEGSLVQAELNAQHEEERTRLLRHKERRNAKKTRRRVNIGGALSVKDANRRIEAREKEEIEKKWRRISRVRLTQEDVPPRSTTPEGSACELPIVHGSIGPGEEPQPLFMIDRRGER